MDKEKAQQLVSDAQRKFVNTNLSKVIEIIDGCIEREAKGSKQYKSTGVSIVLERELNIVPGAMVEPVKSHYESRGFKFEYCNPYGDQSPYIRICW